jgi:hypothetical protein
MPECRSIPDPSDTYTATTVTIRMLQAVEYRFCRATQDLDASHYDFRPTPDAMPLGDLISHIGDLVTWTAASLSVDCEKPGTDLDAIQDILQKTAGQLETMSDADLTAVKLGGTREFWYAINGPIADALTHIGQINTYKRLIGITPTSGSYLDGKA